MILSVAGTRMDMKFKDFKDGATVQKGPEFSVLPSVHFLLVHFCIDKYKNANMKSWNISPDNSIDPSHI